jgi:hypothetical protein
MTLLANMQESSWISRIGKAAATAVCFRSFYVFGKYATTESTFSLRICDLSGKGSWTYLMEMNISTSMNSCAKPVDVRFLRKKLGNFHHGLSVLMCFAPNVPIAKPRAGSQRNLQVKRETALTARFAFRAIHYLIQLQRNREYNQNYSL